MCLAKAYLGQGQDRQMVMEDVAVAINEGGKVLLKTLFGEQKEVAASITAVDFQSGSIMLEASRE